MEDGLAMPADATIHGRSGKISEQLLAISAAIQAWRQRQRDSDRRFYRVVDRAEYRLRREALGCTVRSYRLLNDEDRLSGETDAEFRARIRRERQRQRYVASGRPAPRAYNDLSALTPEQKAQRKSDQAADRQRKRRAKKRADRDLNAELSTLSDQEVKEALVQLPLQLNGEKKHHDDPLWGIF